MFQALYRRYFCFWLICEIFTLYFQVKLVFVFLFLFGYTIMLTMNMLKSKFLYTLIIFSFALRAMADKMAEKMAEKYQKSFCFRYTTLKKTIFITFTAFY